MIRVLLALLLGLSALAAELPADIYPPPSIGEVIMQPNQKACTLHWTHPSAYEFAIVYKVGGQTNMETLFFKTHSDQKRHDFKRLVKIAPGTNHFRVQAIEGTLKSQLSGETVVVVNPN